MFICRVGGATLGRGKQETEEGAGEVGGKTFNAFSGYEERLFADAVYEADDAEADRIYAEVDARMESRGKRRREEKAEEVEKAARLGSSRIADEFSALKRDLAKVTEEEWDNLQEIGDRSLRNRPRMAEAYVPVPDAVLVGSLGGGGKAGGAGATPANAGPNGDASVHPDIRGMREARGQMLSLRLGKMSGDVHGQSVVDPQGYLTALTETGVHSTSTVADINKARLLLKSVIMTNRSHGPGWVAAARLEEQAGDLKTARKVILEGTLACPGDEDVWLEAIRLQGPSTVKQVLLDALRQLPQSTNIWLRAAEQEETLAGKQMVFRKALTLLPGSETLWKEAVKIEEPENARILLQRAVECVPQSLSLWLALARLETYESARTVLNRARRALPTEPLIWVHAARLEEAQGNLEMVPKILTRAISTLQKNGVILRRALWLEQAGESEEASAPETARSILRASSGIEVEEEDKLRTWKGDAEMFVRQKRFVCARTLYQLLNETYPTDVNLWLDSAKVEKEHNSREAYEAVLRSAVAQCPTEEILWLMAARSAWERGDVAAARGVLSSAFEANPDSSSLVLAAATLEQRNGHIDRARALLKRVREQGTSIRAWYKSALLEQEFATPKEEEALLVEGLKRFPKEPKLWLMLGQLYERLGHKERALATYSEGTNKVPSSVPLWTHQARATYGLHGIQRVRSVLELARSKVPRNPLLWLEAIEQEQRHGDEKAASALLARAMQECPNSGYLWAKRIELAPTATRKRVALDAIKAADTDAVAVCAVGRLFQQQKQYDKALRWFQRAVTLDPNLADAWIDLYDCQVERLEAKEATQEELEEVERHFVAANPRYGRTWQPFAKSAEHRNKEKLEILQTLVARRRLDREKKTNL